MTVTPAAPTLSAAFSPASVAVNVSAVLDVVFTNTNGFALTQSGITMSLPANLTLGKQAPASTCGGAGLSLSSTSGSVTLSGANIPANGSCNVSFGVTSATQGIYSASIPANALVTGPAGSNTAPASATLNVTAATSSPAGVASGGGGGGGGLDWMDILLIAGVLLIARGHAAKRVVREAQVRPKTRRGR
jgi:hypothetical protein